MIAIRTNDDDMIKNEAGNISGGKLYDAMLKTGSSNISYADEDGYMYNYSKMIYPSEQYVDGTHNKTVFVFINKERLFGTE